MRKELILTILFSLICQYIIGQSARELNREGIAQYNKGAFENAGAFYKDALRKNPNLIEAAYNSGLAYYKEGKYREAVISFKDLINQSTDKTLLAKTYHNLGNSHVKLNQLQEGIEAYQNALRANPKDEETRYNLAFAMHLLRGNSNNKEPEKDSKNLLDKMEKEEESVQQYRRRNKNLGKDVKNW